VELLYWSHVKWRNCGNGFQYGNPTYLYFLKCTPSKRKKKQIVYCVCACVRTRARLEMHTISWLEHLKGRHHSEDLGIDGETKLEMILGKWVGRCGLDASGLG